MADRPFCFVIMPFRPESYFFYLFVQRHLEEKHNLDVERGDHEILTVPIMKKIEAQITRADFLIADVTGNNPNVFYELGLAHNQAKSVILITQSKIEDVPVDIRPFEFIQYVLTEHVAFLSKLDSAVQSLLSPRYTELFKEASVLLSKFNKKTGMPHQSVGEKDFTIRLTSALIVSELPPQEDSFARAAFLLPKILAQTDNFELMAQITEYVKAEHGGPSITATA